MKTFMATLMVLMVLAVPTAVRGQVAASTLVGTVVDAQGGIVPGATVVAVYTPNGSRFETVVQADGKYRIAGLRPGGPYTLTVTLQGFRAAVAADVTLAAGAEQRRDFTLDVAAMTEELTVRAGTALARDLKRAADTISDVVSADGVGRFPDANAAEALRRIPGVSLQIDQGEGRFVVVRGIDASLNNVTVNGQIVGTPAEFGTRGVSMDSVPADLISRLEVTKAVRPDMDANAIGGTINIATLGAFDRPNGLLSGTLRSGYNKLSGRAPFSANLSYGRVFGRVGVMVGGSFSQRRFDSELFRVSNGAWSNFNGFRVPQNQAFFLYDVDRRRQGLNAAVAFRPSNGHELTFRANHNLFRDIEGRQQVEFDLTRGTLSNQTATSGRFSQGRASREYRDYEQQHTINAFMVRGDHLLVGSTLDWSAGFSRGQRDTPRRVDWEFRSAANAFPNTYDVSDPTRPIVTPSANFYTASAFPFRRVRFRTDLEREDVLSGEANLRRDVTLGQRRVSLKTGAKVVTRDKTQDRENQNYTGSSFTLGDFGLAGDGPTDFFKGLAPFGPTLNLAALQQFFDANKANPARLTFDATTTRVDSLTQDFQAEETVAAGFLMGQVDFDRWNVLAGVRVERTSGSYAANELLYARGAFTGNVRPATGDTSYTDVLPGVHVNIFPRQNLVIRAAWTNTLGRPAYSNLAPISVLDEVQDTDGSFTGSLSSGNPNLKPYESMNLDASVEYYLGSGLVSIAPFYKQIDNPIFGLNSTETNVTRNGRVYQRLGFSRPENADAGSITGVELTFQNYFSFLPGPLDGLGVNVNYTATNSSVTLFTRAAKLPFFGQSDHIGTVALLYEKFGVAAQASMSFASPSLDGVGADVEGDVYDDWYRPIDLKLSAPIMRGIRGLIEVSNATGVNRRAYAGISDRRTADERYSWSLYVGLDWRLR